MNSEFIHGNEAKHIPPACAIDRKTSHIPPAVGDWNRGYEPIMNRSSNLQKKAKAVATHILKRRSVNTSKATCKGKLEKLRYEKCAPSPNPAGLDFPDNFMAIMGWRRVSA